MNEEIKEDSNCIIKAFENCNISILQENIGNKKTYYFKASDIGKALGIVNIRSTIQNYDENERVVRNVYDPHGITQRLNLRLVLNSFGTKIIYEYILQYR